MAIHFNREEYMTINITQWTGKYAVSGSIAILTALLLMLLSATAFASGGGRYRVDPWSFGVMGDTQWTSGTDPEGANPEYVSVAVAQELNYEFINHGVRFVIQLGDLTDRAGETGIAARAAAAMPLYAAGIGFFPVRGNHETMGSRYGRDPSPRNYCVDAFRAYFSQTMGTGDYLFDATNFSSPTELMPDAYDETFTFESSDDLLGMSYSFDFGEAGNNARFVVIDSERTAAARSGYHPGQQLSWIEERLNVVTRGTEHAFVMSHRPLMGVNHVDSVFGSSAGSKSFAQEPFYTVLQENGVRYFLGAHDHIHHRSIVESPNGGAAVEELISIGASPKFYSPRGLNSYISSAYGDVKQRETPISEEIHNIGYYIYTVDGPRVDVTYYSDATGNFMSTPDYPYGDNSIPERLYLPEFNFIEKETWGYGNNGTQFIIAQGESYTVVEDSFGDTAAQILDGFNGSTTTDYVPIIYQDVNGTPEDPSDDVLVSAPRPLVKTVNTGWVAKPCNGKTKSDILSIWGMGELGSAQTDTFVLSMTLEFTRMHHLGRGDIGIATWVDSHWVNAVDENFGGTKIFVVGKYKPQYGLGTYGIDPVTRTAWAVLNYNADFAVAKDLNSEPCE